MKRGFGFLFLSIVSFLVTAQESKSKFEISFFISPNLAYHTQNGGDHNRLRFGSYFDYPNDYEVPKAGYSVGVLTNYSINEKLKIQTGLSFSNNGSLTERGKVQDIHIIDGKRTVESAFVFNYYYLDVPFQVKYAFFKKKKLALYSIGGLEVNFNLWNRYSEVYWFEDGSKGRESEEFDNRFLGKYFPNGLLNFKLVGSYEFRRVNFSATVGVGIDIILNPRLTLFLQPTFRYMIRPMLDTPVKWRLYSAGLFSGVSINL